MEKELETVINKGLALVTKMVTQTIDENADFIELSSDADSNKLEAITHFGEFILKVKQDEQNSKPCVARRNNADFVKEKAEKNCNQLKMR